MSGSTVQDRPSEERLRLVQFHIENLFETFTYTIDLKITRHVTAIIAPNGAGKTLCLRLISALFLEKWSTFSGAYFSFIRYRFSDGTRVQINQIPAGNPSEEKSSTGIRMLILSSDGSELGNWTPPLADPSRVPPLARYVPFVTRVGRNEWQHDNTGETYNLQELVEAFGTLFPDNIKNRIYGKVPDALSAIISQIDCHLIETQRLLILRENDEGPYYRTGRQPSSTLAIARKAQALKDIISKDLNVYATLSQSLDRSFPKRVISYTARLASDALRARLHELDEKRLELMEAGILDTEADDPVALPEGPLDDAIARVLSVYVDDTRRKLSSLSTLLSKIKLFKDLIDQRFITKTVQISKQSGIEVVNNGRNVPIEGLSSGEQHQLVLFFELLFEIKPNALILIDEPELSLHVAWQKKFIGDLMKIIELNKFDVILATHSPQLIGRWNDLVVELGDVYEGGGSNETGDGRNDLHQRAYG